MHPISKFILTAVATAAFAAAQNPITADSPYQVRYASNLPAGDSVINITNTGAWGAQLYGPGYGSPAGNICVNVFTLDPGEELVSCCSCLVTPDGLVSLSADTDLIGNTATGVKPTSVVIKLISTLAGGAPGDGGIETAPLIPGSGTSCAGSAAHVDTAYLATGLAAWGTTIHAPASGSGAYKVTETPFTPATLSAGEVASLANRCRGIIGNGSGAGICNSCRTGGLGANRTKL